MPDRGDAEGTWLRIEPEHVILTALKMPEDGPEQSHDEVIVRLREVAGTQARVRLFLEGLRVVDARLCNALEDAYAPPGGISLPVEPVRLELRPHEVATVRLRIIPAQDASWQEQHQ